MASSAPSPAVVCNLGALTPAQRRRRAELAGRVKAAARQVIEVAGGYAFRFEPEEGLLRELTELIDLESRCCPFLRFELRLEPGGGPLWLELAGTGAAQEVVRAELELG
jgi:hypothetical protein